MLGIIYLIIAAVVFIALVAVTTYELNFEWNHKGDKELAMDYLRCLAVGAFFPIVILGLIGSFIGFAVWDLTDNE